MVTKAASFNIKRFEDLFVPLFNNCTFISELRKIHARMIVLDLCQSNYLTTKMVDICDAKEDVDYASSLFKQAKDPNTYLYNALIRTYTHNQLYSDAVHLYKKMLEHGEEDNSLLPDRFTFPFLIKSCAEQHMLLHLGEQCHGHVWKFGAISNTETDNALLAMYINFKDFRDAEKVFDGMIHRDPVSWNTLISGYTKSGQMEEARTIFEEMPGKTIVSWTTLIGGYSRTGRNADAINVFRRMQLAGIEPDFVSMVTVLPACGELGALEVGKWVQFVAEKRGYLRHIPVCNALIEMYAKCGRVDEALQMFDGMTEKDVITWSSMIAGLASHGKALEAIQVFNEMKAARVPPNRITFLSLLSACVHAGLLDQGLRYFESMRIDHGIEPEIEHYGCLIDLLGRSGCLREALDAIDGMAMKADAAIWGSLLSSCKTYRNPEIAGMAMEHLVEFEPDDIGNYVILSNIYARAESWESVSMMRKVMRSKRMKKVPGCSSIEVNNTVEEFVSSDDDKSFSLQIYTVIQHLSLHQSKTDEINEIILLTGDE